jgi:plasmid stabilization system protein ParE
MDKKRNRLVLWSPVAQQDLIDIWEYFVRVAEIEVANDLLHDIEWIAQRLAAIDPRMYRLRNDLMPHLSGGLRSAPVHPYTLFYRTTPSYKDAPEDVEIIRVLHQKRDLPSVLDDDDLPNPTRVPRGNRTGEK